MNNIELTGRLVADPEVKYTANGKVLTKFRLAENVYNHKEKKQEAQFHNIVVFGKRAELIGNTLSKGRKIHVSGSLKINSYVKDGQTRIYTEITIRNFEYCDSMPKTQAS